MTTSKELAERFRQAEAAIDAANKARWAAEALARAQCDAAQAPALAEISALKKTYAERALELAIEASECPRARWGGHMEPSSVRVCEEGLVLSWDINGDYAPEWFLASWEQLLASPPEQDEGGPA